ncbi:TPR repeat protein [Legionella busanensis]|uniref:TPR repeat protein n=1 Tax=Legionella busanensis TaxID=190655 RepID=A0A378KEJ5_9GAMM|nr:tetratricopeptide repeat protein [Legionella busanensis]STX81672.1 TPR repeat protein [Legionella busanensis]STX81732.1 TPR repeat protein [Legionella busanensis]
MPITNSTEITLKDLKKYSNTDLVTVIGQQVLAGNYTNLFLLTTTLVSISSASPNVKDTSLSQSIRALSRQCQKQLDWNCSHALFLEGVFCYLGIERPKDDKQAIYYHEKAITQGNSFSMIERAAMHQWGEGGDINISEAMRLYDKAISLGNVVAMNSQAQIYLSNKDFPKAIKLYEDAILLGYTPAMIERAMMHQYGYEEGGEISFSKAIELYEQAIQLGDSNAMRKRALMYYEGQGGDVNYSEAIRLFEEAIELGDADAMNDRAWMYCQGHGGDINYSEAMKLYKQASQLKHIDATGNCAHMHECGLGTNLNLSKAIKWYERAYRYNNGKDNNINNNLKEKIESILSDEGQLAEDLLNTLWKELIAGESFTQETLSYLSKYCSKTLLERLKTSPEGTSLFFLKQLKLNSLHPVTSILSSHDAKLNHFVGRAIYNISTFFGVPVDTDFKELMRHARNISDSRIAFFQKAIAADEPSVSLNDLSPELKTHIFSFLQPGLVSDLRQGCFFTATPKEPTEENVTSNLKIS